MGGKRLATVSGVPCLSKEGWRGYWGGYGCWWKAGGIRLLVESGWDTVAGGKRVGYGCWWKAGGIRLLVESGWDMVAGGKRVGYVWDLYVQAFHVCLFCL